MTAISRLASAWNRFWFAPISARPLGMFRVVFGGIAVFNLLLMTVDFDYWLTGRGLLRGEEPLQVATLFRPSILHWLRDPTSARVVFGLTLAAAVGLTLGWRTRLMSVLFYVGMLSIHHRNIMTDSGADTLLMCVAFYLMLSPCGAAYSLDARREARRRGFAPAEPIIVPWAQRLIQIQLTCLYMVTALLKVNGETWLGGTAMHYVLCNREVGRFDVSFLCDYPVLICFLTYAGLATELCLAFLLWSKSARRWVMPLGLMLHAGILFIINIPVFGELTTACYLCFLTPEEFDWLRRRFDVLGGLRALRARLVAIPGRLPAGGALGVSSEAVGPV